MRQASSAAAALLTSKNLYTVVAQNFLNSRQVKVYFLSTPVVNQFLRQKNQKDQLTCLKSVSPFMFVNARAAKPLI